MNSTVSVDVFKCRQQLLVDGLMARMHAHPVGREKQALPTRPCIPPVAVRKLRASLLIEEVLETIDAMGLKIVMKPYDVDDLHRNEERRGYLMLGRQVKSGAFEFEETGEPPNLIKTLDGNVDIAVVNYGCASAHGAALEPLFNLGSGNNLLKFAPGHSFNDIGKLVKPTGHPAPDFVQALKEQGASDELLK